MLEKISKFMASYSFGMALGIVFMILSLFECGVQAGVTFLTGVIICGIESIVRELETLNSKKD